MMQVAKLTKKQAEQLKGVEFVKDNFFNPVLDADGNYIISLEEVEQCDIEWVKSLPLIEYKQITQTL
jgi:hypothetical protein